MLVLAPGSIGGKHRSHLVTSNATSALSEPVYSASNPNHVSHLFDDWASYAVVADIPTQARPDGGGSWDCGASGTDTSALSFVAADPWSGSSQALRVTATTAGETNPGIRTVDVSRFVNIAGTEDVMVVEWAARYASTNWFEGKTQDYNNFASTPHRFNFDPTASSLGHSNTFAGDQLATLYYSNGGATALFSDIPPTWTTFAPCVWRDDSNDMQPILGDATMRYKQNTNWGTAAGAFFSWTSNADHAGTGAVMNDGLWRLMKLRYTNEGPSSSYGRGRLEMWVGTNGSAYGSHGALLKIMEYLGDQVGGLVEDLVYIGPDGASMVDAGRLSVYFLTAAGYAGSGTVDVGYVRVWSHPRQSL